MKKPLITIINKKDAQRKNLEKYFFIGILLCALFGALFYFSFGLTGKVSLSLDDLYAEEGALGGTMSFVLQQSELIPVNTQVIISNDGEDYIYSLGDLVNEEIIEGDFYVQGKNLIGQGAGYGLSENRFPAVSFVLGVYEKTESEQRSIPEQEVVPSDVSPVDEELVEEVEVEEEAVDEASSEVPSVDEEEEVVEEEEVGEIDEEFVEEEVVEEEAVDEASPDVPSEEGKEEEVEEEVEEIEFDVTITGNAVYTPIEEIEGEVRANEEFLYDLEEGQTAEIESSEQDVELEVNDNQVIITTDYIGEETKTIEVSLDDLNIEVQEGELNVRFVYEDIELYESSMDIEIEDSEIRQIESEDNETKEIEGIRGEIQATNVTECGVDFEEGVYDLNESVTATGPGEDCFEIYQSNVLFDCHGHDIIGSGQGGNGFLLAEGENVTVRNCNISNFGYGFYILPENNFSLVNNTISNGSEFGIYIETPVGLGNNLINNTIFGGGQYGIYIYGTIIQGALIKMEGNNISSSSSYNLYLGESFANHNITSSNIIEEKPLYYLYNKSDLSYDSDIGLIYNIYGDNITFANSILAEGSENGIYSYYSNNSNYINLTVNNNYQGAYFRYSYNNSIENCSFSLNEEAGIFFSESDNNNLTNNTFRDTTSQNAMGCYLFQSDNITFVNNTFFNNTVQGLYFENSFDALLTGNNFSSNARNLDFYYHEEAWYNNNITSSNIVEGKTVRYHYNESDIFYDSSSNVGMAYCILCDNFTLKDNVLAGNNKDGVYLYKSNNSLIQNITSNYQENYGIYVYGENNTVDSCVANNNSVSGIAAINSLYTVVNNSRVENSGQFGFRIDGNGAIYSNFTNNTAENNVAAGFYLTTDVDNILFINNTANSNQIGFYSTVSSSNNIFISNIASNNTQQGFSFLGSSYNNLTSNIASNNTQQGFSFSESSSYNNLTSNIANNNTLYGFYFGGGSYNNLTLCTSDFDKTGFVFASEDNLTIVDSRSSNSFEYGIVISDGGDNEINDTTLYSQGGISIDSSNNSFNNITIGINHPTSISLTDYDYDGYIFYINSTETAISNTLSNISKYLNITSDATPDYMNLYVNYDTTDVENVSEGALKLYKHNGTGWDALDFSSSSPSGNYVYSRITSFGDLGVFTGCGNGVLDSGESCDGSNLNGKVLADFGYTSGTLSCNSNCDGFLVDGRTTTTTATSSSGGGGGTLCVPIWDCTDWAPKICPENEVG